MNVEILKRHVMNVINELSFTAECFGGIVWESASKRMKSCKELYQRPKPTIGDAWKLEVADPKAKDTIDMTNSTEEVLCAVLRTMMFLELLNIEEVEKITKAFRSFTTYPLTEKSQEQWQKDFEKTVLRVFERYLDD